MAAMRMALALFTVYAALFWLQLVDNLHRTDLWRAGHGACGQARQQSGQRVMLV